MTDSALVVGGSTGFRRASKHLGAAVVLVIGASLTQLLPWGARANNAGALRESNARLSVVERNNAALTKERADLMSDSEIRRLAREEFGLAPTGADVYAVANLRPQAGADGSSASSGVRSGARIVAPTTVVADELDTSPQPSRLSRVINVLVFWD